MNETAKLVRLTVLTVLTELPQVILLEALVKMLLNSKRTASFSYQAFEMPCVVELPGHSLNQWLNTR